MTDDDFDYVTPPMKIVKTFQCFEWKPIETAPKDGTDILVLLWGNTCMVVGYDSDHSPAYPWGTLDGPHYAVKAATHWMPLPKPPTTQPGVDPGADTKTDTALISSGLIIGSN